MSVQPNIDGVLIQWGDRLFYPGNRILKVPPQPKLAADLGRWHAAAIRARIEATVVRRAPQVMVKVTGGGRGMKAIVAHLRYISRGGRLDIEDEQGQTMRGKDALRELADDWRVGGTRIDDVSDRREAYNIMLSMPRGIDPLVVQRASREFVQAELADHKVLMVLHDHQANPHVHISVRAESKHGQRLNPRKADLHRWRETFAEKLRGWGVEAEATRQATRGRSHNPEPLWRIKAREGRRLRSSRADVETGPAAAASRIGAIEAWAQVARSLAMSSSPEDQQLAVAVSRFVREMPSLELLAGSRERQHADPRAAEPATTHRGHAHHLESRDRTRGPERA